MEGLILTKPSHGGARTNAGSVAREDFGFQSVWATLLLSAALLLATHQAHGAATPGHGDSLGRVSELDVAVQVSGGSGAFLLRPGGFGYLSRSQAMGQAGRDVIDTMITTPGLETFMTALQIAARGGRRPFVRAYR
jgi:hypothetical protein